MEENNGISQAPASNMTPPPAPTPTATPSPAPSPIPSSNGSVVMTKLPGIGAMLGQAWSAYKARLKTSILLQLSVFGIVIGGIIVGALAYIAGNAINQTIGLIILVIVGLVLLVVVAYFSIWLQTSQIILFTMTDEEVGFKNALTKAKPLMGRFFWTSLVTALIVMGGFLLLLIPGIILSTLLAFSVYIAVAEGRKTMDSITASREYVRGFWWPVFGRLFLMGFLYFILYIIVTIITGVIGSLTFDWVGAILNNIFAIIIAPLLIAIPYTIYTQLKNIKGVVPSATEGHWKYITIAVIGGLLIPIMLLSSVVLLALNSARGKSRDALRVAHIRQIESALELYRNDMQAYPASLNDLVGKGFTSVPVSPTPPDGTCTEEQNQYMYKLITPQRYTIEFCLGASPYNSDSTLSPLGIGFTPGVNKVDSDELFGPAEEPQDTSSMMDTDYDSMQLDSMQMSR